MPFVNDRNIYVDEIVDSSNITSTHITFRHKMSSFLHSLLHTRHSLIGIRKPEEKELHAESVLVGTLGKVVARIPRERRLDTKALVPAQMHLERLAVDAPCLEAHAIGVLRAQGVGDVIGIQIVGIAQLLAQKRAEGSCLARTVTACHDVESTVPEKMDYLALESGLLHNGMRFLRCEDKKKSAHANNLPHKLGIFSYFYAYLCRADEKEPSVLELFPLSEKKHSTHIAL